MCQLYLKLYSPKIRTCKIFCNWTQYITKLTSNTCELKISTICSVFCSKYCYTHFIHKYKCKSNGTKNDRPMYLKKIFHLQRHVHITQYLGEIW